MNVASSVKDEAANGNRAVGELRAERDLLNALIAAGADGDDLVRRRDEVEDRLIGALAYRVRWRRRHPNRVPEARR